MSLDLEALIPALTFGIRCLGTGHKYVNASKALACSAQLTHLVIKQSQQKRAILSSSAHTCLSLLTVLVTCVSKSLNEYDETQKEVRAV